MNYLTGFDNYHKITVRDYVRVKILAYATYMGKYQKANIKHYNYSLVIFQSTFPKLVLI